MLNNCNTDKQKGRLLSPLQVIFSFDRIAFDSDQEITLYFGNARISLGTDDYIDEKINEMHLLLPKLEGYKGTLHMENYSGEESNFSFDVDEDLNAPAENDENTDNDESDDSISENNPE